MIISWFYILNSTTLNSIKISEIYPLFPSTVAKIILDLDFDVFKNEIDNLKYDKITSNGSSNILITEDRKILNNFPKEKEIFLECFNEFKRNILKQDSCDFQITTSWAIKSLKESYGQYHKHCNSVYSGVFYFDDSNVAIEFDCENIIPYQIMLPNPSEWNIHNSKIWKFFPQKNMLLFFPSYMRHRITENNSENDRTSLAFNMFPVGKIGEKDSVMNLKLID